MIGCSHGDGGRAHSEGRGVGEVGVVQRWGGRGVGVVERWGGRRVGWYRGEEGEGWEVGWEWRERGGRWGGSGGRGVGGGVGVEGEVAMDDWKSDMVVEFLDLQCSKLLADISVIQFYPSKFVLITDILDKFGMSCVHVPSFPRPIEPLPLLTCWSHLFPTASPLHILSVMNEPKISLLVKLFVNVYSVV